MIKRKKCLKIIIIVVSIVIVIAVSIYLYFHLKKTKKVFLRSNIPDYQLQIFDDNSAFPKILDNNDKNISLDLPDTKQTLILSKDGYLDQYVIIDNILPINLISPTLMKADNIDLSISNEQNEINSNSFSEIPITMNQHESMEKYYYFDAINNKIIYYDFNTSEDKSPFNEVYTTNYDFGDKQITFFEPSPDKTKFLTTLLSVNEDFVVDNSAVLINPSNNSTLEMNDVSNIQWLDDTNFLFFRNNNDVVELTKSDINLENRKKVIDLPSNSFNLTLAPNKKLVSVNYSIDDQMYGAIINLELGDKKEFSLEYSESFTPKPKWSLDSQKIAFFNENGDILIFDSNGEKLQSIKNQVESGIFVWASNNKDFFYLVNDSTKDMPFIIKDRQGKIIADFIDGVKQLNVDGNYLFIIQNNNLIRINIQ